MRQRIIRRGVEAGGEPDEQVVRRTSGHGVLSRTRAVRIITVLTLLASGGVIGRGIGGSSPASAVPSAAEPTYVAAANSHTCGLTPTGTVVCWGLASLGATSVPPATTFTRVIAEGNYSCGLTTTGAPRCWGNGTAISELPTLPPGTVFRQIQGGPFHVCGVTPTSSVLCWGGNGFNQTAVPAGLPPTASVTAGGTHTCALSTSGAVRCWGRSSEGQTTPPVGVTFTQISAGTFHTCGVSTDADVRCWGQNLAGQAPLLLAGPFVQVSAGAQHTCALRPDGSAVCFGNASLGATNVPAAERFDEISAGGDHTCALTQTGGRITCWGNNGSGQTTAPNLVFGPVPPDTTAPIVTGTATTEANAAGWYNSPVSVTWSVDDASATVPADGLITVEGAASSIESEPSCDPAGNCATGTYTVALDLTPPSGVVATLPAGNEFDWNNGSVTLTVACSDALSGVASCPEPVALTEEGIHTAQAFSIVDVAGNVTSVSSRPVSIDLTPPDVALIGPADGSTVRQADYVRPTCTASDALSGLDGVCSVTISDPVTVTGGYTETAFARASDRAGNTATTTPVTYRVVTDAAGPVIDPTATPAPNAAGWWRTAVSFHFTCSDPSGVASCPADRTVSSEGSNQSFTVSATDIFGTSSQLTVSAVNVDLTPPVVNVVVPASVGPLDAVTITCSATDTLSGVAVSDCADRTFPATDLMPGTNSFTFSATDGAGNTTTVTRLITLVVPTGGLMIRADMGVPGLEEIGFQTNKVTVFGSFATPREPKESNEQRESKESKDDSGRYSLAVRWTTGGPFVSFDRGKDGGFAASTIYDTAGARTVTVRICDRFGVCATDDVVVHTSVAERITPVLSCVSIRPSRDEKSTASWGYDNPATIPIYVKSDSRKLENVFTPGDDTRGQPQVFLPGSFRSVFTTKLKPTDLTWRVNGRTAKATSTSPPC